MNNSEIGVLTAADSHFFPGLFLLKAGLGKDFPLCVFDLGLDLSQRAWCSRNDVLVLIPRLHVAHSIHGWQMWNKPYFWSDSPFQTTLWLDADCYVVSSLAPVFARLRECALVVKHPFGTDYPNPNHPALYDLWPVPRRLFTSESINSGVFGFNKHRDMNLIRACTELTNAVALDPALRSLIHWFDEGVLHWAIGACNAHHIILDAPGWNRFFRIRTKNLLDFLHQLPHAHDGDLILHFTGLPKPWDDWDPATRDGLPVVQLS